MRLLTLLLPPDDVLEEVNRDTLWSWEVCLSIYSEELVHLVLGTELGGELCRGDSLFGGGMYLH